MIFDDLGGGVGIVISELNPILKVRLKKACEEIKSKFFDNKSHDMLNQFHRRLGGYDTDIPMPHDLRLALEKELRILINDHESRFNYFHRMYNYSAKINGDVVLELERMWFNFQRKGEFLPIHDHSGVYSFVIWAEVPFYLKDESELSPNSTLIKNRSGYFQFLYTNGLGKITTHDLPVDKTWEGRICVFPANLPHLVYPFYSSDEPRITISGNFRVDPYAINENKI